MVLALEVERELQVTFPLLFTPQPTPRLGYRPTFSSTITSSHPTPFGPSPLQPKPPDKSKSFTTRPLFSSSTASSKSNPPLELAKPKNTSFISNQEYNDLRSWIYFRCKQLYSPLY